MIRLGALQISCNKVSNDIENLFSLGNELIQWSDSKQLFFLNNLYLLTQKSYAFSCAVDDHYFSI